MGLHGVVTSLSMKISGGIVTRIVCTNKGKNMSNKINKIQKGSESHWVWFVYGLLLIGECLVQVLSLGRYTCDWAFNYVFSDKFK